MRVLLSASQGGVHNGQMVLRLKLSHYMPGQAFLAPED